MTSTKCPGVTPPVPSSSAETVSKLPCLPYLARSVLGPQWNHEQDPYNIIEALTAAASLLTVPEAASPLRKSETTIDRMARAKQIPSTMIAGSRMFDPSTLITWLARKEPQLLVAARNLRQEQLRGEAAE